MASTLLQTIANFETSISAKLTAAGTSLILTSNLDKDGVAIPSGTYGFTLDEGKSNEEHIIGTVSGSTVTITIRNVSRQNGTTAGTGKEHRKGASIKITDHPLLVRMRRVLDGTDALNSTIPMRYDAAPTFIAGSQQIVTVAYADALVGSGVADATNSSKGKVKISVAAVDVAQPIAVGDNDGRVPTQGENDAIAGGSTFGTPSSTNKFITQEYNSSATGIPIIRTYTAGATWTKPRGLKYVIAEVVGGGGGGGGTTNINNVGGGGGGGGYSKEILAAASLGATEAVTVGAAGAAGAATGGAGGNGGTSSFGTAAFLQATGGTGGELGSSQSSGGAGGVGSNGTLNIEGTDGGGGIGGEIAGSSHMGLSGSGGSSFLGGGARAVSANSTDNNVGIDGNNYGGGGSGAANANNASDAAGGAGAAGVVVITEYYS